MKYPDLETCRWFRYKVPIVGGINRYYEVIAPNKTIARSIAEGETHPWIHVKGKIIEVEEVKDCIGRKL